MPDAVERRETAEGCLGHMVSEKSGKYVQLIANFIDPASFGRSVPDRAFGGNPTSGGSACSLFCSKQLIWRVNLFRCNTPSCKAGCTGGPGWFHASGCILHPVVQDRRWNTRNDTPAPKRKGSRARRSILMARHCANRPGGSARVLALSATCQGSFPSPQRRSGFCVHSFPTRSVPSCVVTANGGEYL